MPWLTSVLKLFVALGILYWLVESGKFDPNSLKKISDPRVWAGGLLVFFTALAVNTQRWRMLLRFENVNIGFVDAYSLSLIGIFFNFVIPGGVGGDIVKASYLFKRYKSQKWFIGWATLTDRILGVLSLLVYASTMGFLFHSHLGKVGPSVYTFSLLALLGLFSGLMIVLMAPKARIENFLNKNEKLKKILWPPYFYFSQPLRILPPILLSFLGQFLMISIVVVMESILNFGIPTYVYFMIVPIGFISTIIPVAPAGLGVGQAAFYFLFETVAGQGETGVLAITFYQAVQFLTGLVGGCLFVLYGKKIEVPANG